MIMLVRYLKTELMMKKPERGMKMNNNMSKFKSTEEAFKAKQKGEITAVEFYSLLFKKAYKELQEEKQKKNKKHENKSN